jgi:hypothetical protein
VATATAEALTRRWLERWVLELDLCPFVAPVLRDDTLRIAVSSAVDPGGWRHDFLVELDYLQSHPEAEVATTLLVYDPGPVSFEDFLDLLADAEADIEELALAEIVQLASFHPHYRFSGEAEDAVSNYSNRSPLPTLHLLRQSTITRALAGYRSPELIPRRNIATLQRLGLQRVAARWRADFR